MLPTDADPPYGFIDYCSFDVQRRNALPFAERAGSLFTSVTETLTCTDREVYPLLASAASPYINRISCINIIAVNRVSANHTTSAPASTDPTDA